MLLLMLVSCRGNIETLCWVRWVFWAWLRRSWPKLSIKYFTHIFMTKILFSTLVVSSVWAIQEYEPNNAQYSHNLQNMNFTLNIQCKLNMIHMINLYSIPFFLNETRIQKTKIFNVQMILLVLSLCLWGHNSHVLINPYRQPCLFITTRDKTAGVPVLLQSVLVCVKCSFSRYWERKLSRSSQWLVRETE